MRRPHSLRATLGRPPPLQLDAPLGQRLQAVVLHSSLMRMRLRGRRCEERSRERLTAAADRRRERHYATLHAHSTHSRLTTAGLCNCTRRLLLAVAVSALNNEESSISVAVRPSDMQHRAPLAPPPTTHLDQLQRRRRLMTEHFHSDSDSRRTRTQNTAHRTQDRGTDHPSIFTVTRLWSSHVTVSYRLILILRLSLRLRSDPSNPNAGLLLNSLESVGCLAQAEIVVYGRKTT